MIPAVDVGAPQGTITATQWKHIHDVDGRILAAIRCSEGLGAVDSTFDENVVGSRAAGETIFPYFVFHAWVDPVAQAELWFATAKGLGFAPGDAPPAIDVELDHDGARALTPTQMRAALIPCLQRMEELWGRPGAFYSFPFFLHALLAGATDAELAALKRWSLWYASYNGTPPEPPPPWDAITLWQNGGGTTYKTPGGAPCDADFFMGDEAALAAYVTPPAKAAGPTAQ